MSATLPISLSLELFRCSVISRFERKRTGLGNFTVWQLRDVTRGFTLDQRSFGQQKGEENWVSGGGIPWLKKGMWGNDLTLVLFFSQLPWGMASPSRLSRRAAHGLTAHPLSRLPGSSQDQDSGISRSVVSHGYTCTMPWLLLPCVSTSQAMIKFLV